MGFDVGGWAGRLFDNVCDFFASDDMWPPDEPADARALGDAWGRAGEKLQAVIDSTGQSAKDIFLAWNDGSGQQFYDNLNDFNGSVASLITNCGQLKDFCYNYAQQIEQQRWSVRIEMIINAASYALMFTGGGAFASVLAGAFARKVGMMVMGQLAKRVAALGISAGTRSMVKTAALKFVPVARVVAHVGKEVAVESTEEAVISGGSQLAATGQIDSKQLKTDTLAGGIGGALGYAPGKAISKVVPGTGGVSKHVNAALTGGVVNAFTSPAAGLLAQDVMDPTVHFSKEGYLDALKENGADAGRMGMLRANGNVLAGQVGSGLGTPANVDVQQELLDKFGPDGPDGPPPNPPSAAAPDVAAGTGSAGAPGAGTQVSSGAGSSGSGVTSGGVNEGNAGASASGKSVTSGAGPGHGGSGTGNGTQNGTQNQGTQSGPAEPNGTQENTTTGGQTTEQQTTGQQTSEQQTTGQQTSEQQATGQRTTEQQATGQQTSEQQATGQQTTGQQAHGEQSHGQQGEQGSANPVGESTGTGQSTADPATTSGQTGAAVVLPGGPQGGTPQATPGPAGKTGNPARAETEAEATGQTAADPAANTAPQKGSTRPVEIAATAWEGMSQQVQDAVSELFGRQETSQLVRNAVARLAGTRMPDNVKTELIAMANNRPVSVLNAMADIGEAAPAAIDTAMDMVRRNRPSANDAVRRLRDSLLRKGGAQHTGQATQTGNTPATAQQATSSAPAGARPGKPAGMPDAVWQGLSPEVWAAATTLFARPTTRSATKEAVADLLAQPVPDATKMAVMAMASKLHPSVAAALATIAAHATSPEQLTAAVTEAGKGTVSANARVRAFAEALRGDPDAQLTPEAAPDPNRALDRLRPEEIAPDVWRNLSRELRVAIVKLLADPPAMSQKELQVLREQVARLAGMDVPNEVKQEIMAVADRFTPDRGLRSLINLAERAHGSVAYAAAIDLAQRHPRRVEPLVSRIWHLFNRPGAQNSILGNAANTPPPEGNQAPNGTEEQQAAKNTETPPGKAKPGTSPGPDQPAEFTQEEWKRLPKSVRDAVTDLFTHPPALRAEQVATMRAEIARLAGMRVPNKVKLEIVKAAGRLWPNAVRELVTLAEHGHGSLAYEAAIAYTATTAMRASMPVRQIVAAADRPAELDRILDALGMSAFVAPTGIDPAVWQGLAPPVRAAVGGLFSQPETTAAVKDEVARTLGLGLTDEVTTTIADLASRLHHDGVRALADLATHPAGPLAYDAAVAAVLGNVEHAEALVRRIRDIADRPATLNGLLGEVGLPEFTAPQGIDPAAWQRQPRPVRDAIGELVGLPVTDQRVKDAVAAVAALGLPETITRAIVEIAHNRQPSVVAALADIARLAPGSPALDAAVAQAARYRARGNDVVRTIAGLVRANSAKLDDYLADLPEPQRRPRKPAKGEPPPTGPATFDALPGTLDDVIAALTGRNVPEAENVIAGIAQLSTRLKPGHLDKYLTRMSQTILRDATEKPLAELLSTMNREQLTAVSLQFARLTDPRSSLPTKIGDNPLGAIQAAILGWAGAGKAFAKDAGDMLVRLDEIEARGVDVTSTRDTLAKVIADLDVNAGAGIVREAGLVYDMLETLAERGVEVGSAKKALNELMSDIANADWADLGASSANTLDGMTNGISGALAEAEAALVLSRMPAELLAELGLDQLRITGVRVGKDPDVDILGVRADGREVRIEVKDYFSFDLDSLQYKRVAKQVPVQRKHAGDDAIVIVLLTNDEPNAALRARWRHHEPTSKPPGTHPVAVELVRLGADAVLRYDGFSTFSVLSGKIPPVRPTTTDVAPPPKMPLLDLRHGVSQQQTVHTRGLAEAALRAADHLTGMPSVTPPSDGGTTYRVTHDSGREFGATVEVADLGDTVAARYSIDVDGNVAIVVSGRAKPSSVPLLVASALAEAAAELTRNDVQQAGQHAQLLACDYLLRRNPFNRTARARMTALIKEMGLDPADSGRDDKLAALPDERMREAVRRHTSAIDGYIGSKPYLLATLLVEGISGAVVMAAVGLQPALAIVTASMVRATVQAAHTHAVSVREDAPQDHQYAGTSRHLSTQDATRLGKATLELIAQQKAGAPAAPRAETGSTGEKSGYTGSPAHQLKRVYGLPRATAALATTGAMGMLLFGVSMVSVVDPHILPVIGMLATAWGTAGIAPRFLASRRQHVIDVKNARKEDLARQADGLVADLRDEIAANAVDRVGKVSDLLLRPDDIAINDITRSVNAKEWRYSDGIANQLIRAMLPKSAKSTQDDAAKHDPNSVAALLDLWHEYLGFRGVTAVATAAFNAKVGKARFLSTQDGRARRTRFDLTEEGNAELAAFAAFAAKSLGLEVPDLVARIQDDTTTRSEKDGRPTGMASKGWFAVSGAAGLLGVGVALLFNAMLGISGLVRFYVAGTAGPVGDAIGDWFVTKRELAALDAKAELADADTRSALKKQSDTMVRFGFDVRSGTVPGPRAAVNKAATDAVGDVLARADDAYWALVTEARALTDDPGNSFDELSETLVDRVTALHAVAEKAEALAQARTEAERTGQPRPEVVARDKLVFAIQTYNAIPGMTPLPLAGLIDGVHAGNADAGRLRTDLPNLPAIPADANGQVAAVTMDQHFRDPDTWYQPPAELAKWAGNEGWANRVAAAAGLPGRQFHAVSAINDVVARLTQLGENSRAILYAQRTDAHGVPESGDLINAVNVGGTVYLIDAVTGAPADVSGYQGGLSMLITQDNGEHARVMSGAQGAVAGVLRGVKDRVSAGYRNDVPGSLLTDHAAPGVPGPSDPTSLSGGVSRIAAIINPDRYRSPETIAARERPRVHHAYSDLWDDELDDRPDPAKKLVDTLGMTTALAALAMATLDLHGGTEATRLREYRLLAEVLRRPDVPPSELLDAMTGLQDALLAIVPDDDDPLEPGDSTGGANSASTVDDSRRGLGADGDRGPFGWVE